jgi:hypothetical protein
VIELTKLPQLGVDYEFSETRNIWRDHGPVVVGKFQQRLRGTLANNVLIDFTWPADFDAQPVIDAFAESVRAYKEKAGG